MKVLVLGGTNFIGRHIVDALAGRHDVSVLNRGSRSPEDPRITHLVMDRTDSAAVRAGIRGPFDAVVDVSATEPAHVLGTATALRDSGVRRYLLLSSGAVYDSRVTPRPFREDATPSGDPVWGPYGVAKGACESAVEDAGFDEVFALRPPYVYGPGNNEPREQFLWARMIARRPILVPGKGTTKIQFCPVEYLATTVQAAIAGQFPPGVYNVAEVRPYSFNEYIDVLAEAAGVSAVDVRHIEDSAIPAREFFPFRNYDMVLNVAKLASHITDPPAGLSEGLRRTFTWFRDNTALPYEPTPRELQLIGHG